jgi:hypothetical protein
MAETSKLERITEAATLCLELRKKCEDECESIMKRALQVETSYRPKSPLEIPDHPTLLCQNDKN